MITTRGWWFLVFAVLVLALGVLGHHATLALLGLTLVLWFAGQGLVFAYRVRLVTRDLVVRREVHDERGPVDTLWAGRTFEVRVTLALNHAVGLPHVAVADWVPFA